LLCPGIPISSLVAVDGMLVFARSLHMLDAIARDAPVEAWLDALDTLHGDPAVCTRPRVLSLVATPDAHDVILPLIRVQLP
jgi:hypothetical protein